MTEIDKAIAFFEEWETDFVEDGDDEQAAHCTRAVMALQERGERLKQRETPLTYAELGELDNKPVFLQFGTGEQQWAICCVQGERIYFYGPLLENEEPDECFYNMTPAPNNQPENYGLHKLGWRAWREEPKQKGGAR